MYYVSNRDGKIHNVYNRKIWINRSNKGNDTAFILSNDDEVLEEVVLYPDMHSIRQVIGESVEYLEDIS